MSGKGNALWTAVAAAAVAMAGIAGSQVQAAEELNALAWCDHADAKLLEPFEKEHGVKVNVKDFDGMGNAMAIIEGSQPGDFDVFSPEAPDVVRLAELGLLEALNPADFPMGDVFEALKTPERFTVDGKVYAIPEKFGYLPTGFRSDKVDAADLSSISIWWDPKYKNRVAIYDYYNYAISNIALALGIKPTALGEGDLDRVREKLFAIKDNGAVVGGIVEVQTMLSTGEVDILANAGEFAISVLQADNPKVDWNVPEEGTMKWVQAVGIFKASKKKDLALKFVQYLMSPKGQGLLATSDCYWGMPTNQKAELTAEQKKRLRWDEQPGFLARAYWPVIPGENEDLDEAMLDLWQEFLAR